MLLVVNMLFTKEDKIMIKILLELKGYNAKYYYQRVSQQRLECWPCVQLVANDICT